MFTSSSSGKPRILKRLAQTVVVLAAALAIPVTAANAWTPPGTYTLATPGSSVLRATVNITGSPWVESGASFTAALTGTTTANAGTVPAATFPVGTSSAGLPSQTSKLGTWTVNGVNTGGGSGTVTIRPTFRTVLTSGGSPVGDIVVGNGTQTVTGAYSALTGLLNLTGGASTLTVQSSSGVLATIPPGSPVSLTGTQQVAGAVFPALN